MNEDEKMFQIGRLMALLAAVLIVVLQVCYRTQNRVINHVRAEINAANHQIAIYETKFAEYVLPGALRDRVTTNTPHAETIGFNKNITIGELADRK